ncbi:NAD(P)-binding protein [Karstenula rhodostoma CBS 690.94]|uniref:NAD(P)-binding protein n=1 Tax=Karstenula rhodostoma CBS 690.94 TaxID=1392251 RepID=A0A9P4PBQ1_9PLEO|nr:NAD(P)-binding protein [Karstenula rhodostoma CBS 690.94]
MAKQKVLLLGAHGETGGNILAGLIEDGSFDISCLVQPSSTEKPAVKALATRGLPIVVGDLAGDVDELAKVLEGYDTLISAINTHFIRAQLKLVDAAKKAGVKRFVPCDFGPVIPPGGVKALRDEKEVVHQRVWHAHLPYTYIDIGYWYQISFFRVPSGRFDYAIAFDTPEIFGDGNTKTLLSDKRDIGRFIARIIRDPRTLNHSVVAWGDEITQNEIVALIKAKTGETPSVSTVSADTLEAAISTLAITVKNDPGNGLAGFKLSVGEYSRSKWIRGDGTLENAKYLGYLNARELYPDLKPRRFEKFLEELVEGNATRPYEETLLKDFGGAKERVVIKLGE